MSKEKTRTVLSFDYAMKKLLRQKSNFKILEGFLSELLGKDIFINSCSLPIPIFAFLE
jgi:hypothetical protein